MPEAKRHVFGEFLAWKDQKGLAELRQRGESSQLGEPLSAAWMAPALWYCGLANEDPAVTAATVATVSILDEDDEVGTAAAWTTEDEEKETWVDGRFLAGSDGSGLHPREKGFGVAGMPFGMGRTTPGT